MATVRERLGGWANEQCVAYLEYDDATMRISGVRVVNSTGFSIWLGLIRASDRLLYENTFPPGETYIPIPTTGAGRVTITKLERGHYEGIEIVSRFPA